MSIRFLTAKDLISLKHGDKLKLATLEELRQESDFLLFPTHILPGDPYITTGMKRNFGKEIPFIGYRTNRSTHFEASDGYYYDIRWCTRICKQSKYRWKR